MATNIVHEEGNQIYIAATQPASPVSGNPVLVGQLPGVALTSRQADGKETIKFNGTATLSVHAVNEVPASAAVAVGDILYYDAAAAVKINKDATNGVRFGYALEAVAGGATATILVKIGY